MDRQRAREEKRIGGEGEMTWHLGFRKEVARSLGNHESRDMHQRARSRQGEDRDGTGRARDRNQRPVPAETHHVGREGVVVGGEVVPVWFIVEGRGAQVYHNLKKRSELVTV